MMSPDAWTQHKKKHPLSNERLKLTEFMCASLEKSNIGVIS